jgi:hypothetical protein
VKKAGTCHGVTSAALLVNYRNAELPINHHAKGQNVDISMSTSPESLLQQSAENGILIAAAEIFLKPFSLLTLDHTSAKGPQQFTSCYKLTAARTVK